MEEWPIIRGDNLGASLAFARSTDTWYASGCDNRPVRALMPNIDRRTLLYVLGAASVSPLLAFPVPAPGQPVVVKPDENRFPYASPQQAKRSPCKLTSSDTAGA